MRQINQKAGKQAIPTAPAFFGGSDQTALGNQKCWQALVHCRAAKQCLRQSCRGAWGQIGKKRSRWRAGPRDDNPFTSWLRQRELITRRTLWYNPVARMRSIFTGRKLPSVPRRWRVGYRFSGLSQLLTGTVLLAQLQLFCLASFHYHAQVPAAGRQSSTIGCSPRQPGTPAGRSDACPFCQLVRHHVSTPPAASPLSIGNFCSTWMLPSVAAIVPAASHLRLAGRDPPLWATC